MITTTISLSDFKKSLKKSDATDSSCVTKQQDHLPMFKRTPESFKKFKIERTGEYFYYCNYDNGIYDANMNPISEVTEPTKEWEQAISETRRMAGKSNQPHWIRILLGHACNYSCGYCLQKDIGNPDERSKITTTDRFIEQLSKIDLSQTTKIDLWGGETFLYWKSIVPIIQKFDRPGLTWFMSTNGTPLQMKHIEFFKTLKGDVEIGISHDGPEHERLRGEEFLHKKVDVLRAIQESSNIRFGFNCVITKTNFDFFKINKFFYDFLTSNNLNPWNMGVGWILGRNHDYDNQLNSATHVIDKSTIGEFKSVLNRYMVAGIEQFVTKTANHNLLKNSLFTGNKGVIPYMKTLKKQVLPTITTTCGVDDSRVLSLDIQGNVRVCPNTDESFISGHIEDLQSVKLQKLDFGRYERHCGSCEVFRLCKSNCPIEVPDEVFYSNCMLEKVWHGAVQNAAFCVLFQSNVTLVQKS